MYILEFVHSSVNSLVSCFYLLALVSSGAMSICVCVHEFVWVPVSVLPGEPLILFLTPEVIKYIDWDSPLRSWQLAVGTHTFCCLQSTSLLYIDFGCNPKDNNTWGLFLPNRRWWVLCYRNPSSASYMYGVKYETESHQSCQNCSWSKTVFYCSACQQILVPKPQIPEALSLLQTGAAFFVWLRTDGPGLPWVWGC